MCSYSPPVKYGVDIEVDKPVERVLIHGVNVGQVCNTEEEDGGVLSDGSVALSRLGYFNLSLLCNLKVPSKEVKVETIMALIKGFLLNQLFNALYLLFLSNLIRHDLGSIQNLDGTLVFQDVPL